jgi:hypothetical protein
MTTAKEIESIIERLGHLGMAIHFVYHFLSRLHDLQEQAGSRRSININGKCRNDLQFMIGVIKRAHIGINLNILIYKHSSHVYRLDLCQAGLGGCWYLPPPPLISSIKQTPRTSSGNHHALGRHHQGTSEFGRLCTLNDQQHHFGRLAQEDKLQQTW